MEFSKDKQLTILAVDPTDADDVLEIGMRKKNNENLLLIVPIIPEGHKEHYNFCDIEDYDETKSYNSAFKMAFWLARVFPETIVFISRDIIDERNPISQKIYHHLSNDLPDTHSYVNKDDFPLNLSLNYNELRMLINSYTSITTNVGRPCTGVVYLIDKLRLEDRIKGPIYVQGGCFWGKDSGTTNIPNLFKRTERESMNMARNPTAFMKLVELVKGDICVVTTAFSKAHDLNDVNNLIDNLFPFTSNHQKSIRLEALNNINVCLKKYYEQERFKIANSAKLFDIDLYLVSNNLDNYNKESMSCAIKKGLGEMEIHNGELANNDEYVHFENVTVILSKKEENVSLNTMLNT